MKKQQVKGKVPPAHLQGIFTPHKTKIPSQLDQKILEPQQQAPV